MDTVRAVLNCLLRVVYVSALRTRKQKANRVTLFVPTLHGTITAASRH